ncbi:MAG: prepilin-type N-terminal cleavage/methylation domain-containing protein, partial [Verrucomicrobiota bacterium]
MKSNSPRSKKLKLRRRAFTLVELITSMAIFSVILLILTSMTGTVINTWANSETKVDTVQNARGALEMVTREMTPAVIDTHMQFAIMPGTVLTTDANLAGLNIVEEAQAALWMAAVGADGERGCGGYGRARGGGGVGWGVCGVWGAGGGGGRGGGWAGGG